MNFLNFIPLYVPKGTFKWMILFIMITTIVNMIIMKIKKIRKNKKK